MSESGVERSRDDSTTRSRSSPKATGGRARRSPRSRRNSTTAAQRGSVACRTPARDRALASKDEQGVHATGDVPKLRQARPATGWSKPPTARPSCTMRRWSRSTPRRSSTDGRLTVWGGEQDALGTKASWSSSGLWRRRVELLGLAAGGAFGRRVPAWRRHMGQAWRWPRGVAATGQADLHREEEFIAGRLPPGAGDAISAALGRRRAAGRLVPRLPDRPGPATKALPFHTGSRTSRCGRSLSRHM